MEARNILIGYLVVSIAILLIMWWVDPKSVGSVFLWLLFVFIVMLFATARCNGACLIYLAVVALLPIIAWLLWSAFKGCAKASTSS